MDPLKHTLGRMDRWSYKSFTNNRKSQTRDGERKQNKGSKDKSKRKTNIKG